MFLCFSGSGTRRYLSDDADPKEKYQMCASFFLMAWKFLISGKN